ncbi:hypothetical protein [Salinicola halophilus]|uniref:hypothetical protein n=1 Tax=Salinicola halophilus TaxID=184065 RepID=UPI000DA12CF3|nr:hypothetical protein [Salinicola halophilus]
MSRSDNRWHRPELDFLAAKYPLPGWTVTEIQLALPGQRRTRAAIARKAAYLELGKLRRDNVEAIRARMVEDIYDMCVLDYTAGRMAEELTTQYRMPVGEDLVGQLMRERLNACTYRCWLQRYPDRLARGHVRGWETTRRAA